MEDHCSNIRVLARTIVTTIVAKETQTEDRLNPFRLMIDYVRMPCPLTPRMHSSVASWPEIVRWSREALLRHTEGRTLEKKGHHGLRCDGQHLMSMAPVSSGECLWGIMLYPWWKVKVQLCQLKTSASDCEISWRPSIEPKQLQRMADGSLSAVWLQAWIKPQETHLGWEISGWRGQANQLSLCNSVLTSPQSMNGSSLLWGNARH